MTVPASNVYQLMNVLKGSARVPKDRRLGDGHRWQRAVVNGWIDDLDSKVRQTFAAAGVPFVRLARWPLGATFVACLTHDIDYIYHRELFRILADINHLRRVCFKEERGGAVRSLQRIAESMIRPPDPDRPFQRLRRLEENYGWRSTFFLLEDTYWARHGSRYRLDDKAVLRIANYLLEQGCELATHGSYYRFADEAWLRKVRSRFMSVFGFGPIGLRNHYLRFTAPATWQAQASAGFQYDSTFGSNSVPGPLGGLSLPFFPYDGTNDRCLDILELPLTLMDATLFGRMNMEAAAAYSLGREVIIDAKAHRGLVTLLWHNNSFCGQDYQEMGEVYSALLNFLREEGALVMTASEINRWWRARARINFVTDGWGPGWWKGTLRVEEALENLALEIETMSSDVVVYIDEERGELDRNLKLTTVRFPSLAAGETIHLTVANKDTSLRDSREQLTTR